MEFDDYIWYTKDDITKNTQMYLGWSKGLKELFRQSKSEDMKPLSIEDALGHVVSVGLAGVTLLGRDISEATPLSYVAVKSVIGEAALIGSFLVHPGYRHQGLGSLTLHKLVGMVSGPSMQEQLGYSRLAAVCNDVGVSLFANNNFAVQSAGLRTIMAKPLVQ